MSERGLICMGRDVVFVLRDKREFHGRRKRDGMLYDESGYYWPKCSLLIAPFEQGSESADHVSKVRDFFGKKFETFEGRTRLPPRAIGRWRLIGEIDQIFYDRAGKYDGPFRHKFNSIRSMTQLFYWPFKRRAMKLPAVLYALGDCYRVELPEGCVVDDRGIVLP